MSLGGATAAVARSGRGDTRLADERLAAPADEDGADVTLACGGDQAAFERLYRRNVARVHGLARRMAGFDAADEVTQDVFVHAWRRLGTFRGEARFATWLYRLAINTIVERRRDLARRSGFQQQDEGAMNRASVAEVDGVLAIDFEVAVDRLPAAAREVFVLHDVEGYKHVEVSRLLGIAVGTSKAQLHRARMILRRYLRGDRHAPLDRRQA